MFHASSRLRFRRPSPFVTLQADWLARAARCPGRTLHYALALALLAASGNTSAVTPSPWLLARYGVSRDVAGEALTRLVDMGLVRAERRRGRVPTVVLLDADGEELTIAAYPAIKAPPNSLENESANRCRLALFLGCFWQLGTSLTVASMV